MEDSDASALAVRIEGGGFLPMALHLDPLQQILLDIVALIKRYGPRLTTLESQVPTKADRSQLDSLQREVERIARESAATAASQREIATKVESLRGDVDTTMADLKDANRRIDDTNRIASDARRKVDDLATIVTAPPISNEILAAEIAKLKDEINRTDRSLPTVSSTTGGAVAQPPSDSRLAERVTKLGRDLDALRADTEAGNDQTERQIARLRSDFDGLAGWINEIDGRTAFRPKPPGGDDQGGSGRTSSPRSGSGRPNVSLPALHEDRPRPASRGSADRTGSGKLGHGHDPNSGSRGSADGRRAPSLVDSGGGGRDHRGDGRDGDNRGGGSARSGGTGDASDRTGGSTDRTGSARSDQLGDGADQSAGSRGSVDGDRAGSPGDFAGGEGDNGSRGYGHDRHGGAADSGGTGDATDRIGPSQGSAGRAGSGRTGKLGDGADRSGGSRGSADGDRAGSPGDSTGGGGEAGSHGSGDHRGDGSRTSASSPGTGDAVDRPGGSRGSADRTGSGRTGKLGDGADRSGGSRVSADGGRGGSPGNPTDGRGSISDSGGSGGRSGGDRTGSRTGSRTSGQLGEPGAATAQAESCEGTAGQADEPDGRRDSGDGHRNASDRVRGDGTSPDGRGRGGNRPGSPRDLSDGGGERHDSHEQPVGGTGHRESSERSGQTDIQRNSHDTTGGDRGGQTGRGRDSADHTGHFGGHTSDRPGGDRPSGAWGSRPGHGHSGGRHDPDRGGGQDHRETSTEKGQSGPGPDIRPQVATAGGSITAFERLLSEETGDLRGQIAELRDRLHRLTRDVGDRPDRTMIERLFEKFKSSLANVADLIKKGQGDTGRYATVDDVKRLEATFSSVNQEFEEAAAARKSTCCLSCGRPYRQVTGAIQDDVTLAVLGAAPISHLTNDQKPCFVYGSDHELYYSSSPRGRSYASPQLERRNRAKP